MNIEYRQNDRSNRITRHSQRQHWNKRTTNTCIIRRLTGHNTFHSTFTKWHLRFLHNTLRLIISNKRSHRTTGTRKRTNQHTNSRSINRQLPMFKHFLQTNLRLLHSQNILFLTKTINNTQHLSKSKKANQRRYRTDTTC